MVNGDKIRQLREREGLTMKELAERVGVTEAMMSYIERNLRKPTIDVLTHIAKVFGTTIDELIIKVG